MILLVLTIQTSRGLYGFFTIYKPEADRSDVIEKVDMLAELRDLKYEEIDAAIVTIKSLENVPFSKRDFAPLALEYLEARKITEAKESK